MGTKGRSGMDFPNKSSGQTTPPPPPHHRIHACTRLPQAFIVYSFLKLVQESYPCKVHPILGIIVLCLVVINVSINITQCILFIYLSYLGLRNGLHTSIIIINTDIIKMGFYKNGIHIILSFFHTEVYNTINLHLILIWVFFAVALHGNFSPQSQCSTKTDIQLGTSNCWPRCTYRSR